MAERSSRSRVRFDERLLDHHPAGRSCLEICTANGWAPSSTEVVKLVRLWHEHQDGLRSEQILSLERLEFARWLRKKGKISELLNEDGTNPNKAALSTTAPTGTALAVRYHSHFPPI